MIICEVNKNHLNVRTRELLTAGSQNVNTVEFRFNEAWDGLAKTATFKTSKKTISVLLGTNTTKIPWEVLADAGEILAVGVFGVSGETIVLPTVWGILGKVMDAAHLGDEEKEPTPDVYQKILDELNALERPTWDAVQNKPFSTLGGGLSVDENGVLSVQGGGGGSPNAVQYVAQSLTDEQKAQARENIGADPKPYYAKISSYHGVYSFYDGNGYNGLKNAMAEGRTTYLKDTQKEYSNSTIIPYLRNVGDQLLYGFADTTQGMLMEYMVKSDNTITVSYEKVLNAKVVGDALAKKLDKNQGADNAGKILGIGEDGIVVPQDKPAGGSVTVDDALSSTSENPVQNKVVTAALAEKITAPTTAAIGQIIKVKSVDSTGKPTAWGVADLSSGGSEDWTLLAEQTTTEIVKEISFTLPKSVKHVVSKIWCPKTGATEVNRYINVKIGASYLFYYIAPNIPDKSQTSQLTVSADSIGGGYWRLSYYANRGTKTFDNFDGYNQNEFVVVGVTKVTYTEANTFAIMTVETDTTKQFPVGTILKVWGY